MTSGQESRAAGISPEVQSGVVGLGVEQRDDAVFPTTFRAKVPSSVDLIAGLPGDLSDWLTPFSFMGSGVSARKQLRLPRVSSSQRWWHGLCDVLASDIWGPGLSVGDCTPPLPRRLNLRAAEYIWSAPLGDETPDISKPRK